MVASVRASLKGFETFLWTPTTLFMVLHNTNVSVVTVVSVSLSSAPGLFQAPGAVNWILYS